jgi:hypothetical protein
MRSSSLVDKVGGGLATKIPFCVLVHHYLEPEWTMNDVTIEAEYSCIILQKSLSKLLSLSPVYGGQRRGPSAWWRLRSHAGQLVRCGLR